MKIFRSFPALSDFLGLINDLFEPRNGKSVMFDVLFLPTFSFLLLRSSRHAPFSEKYSPLVPSLLVLFFCGFFIRGSPVLLLFSFVSVDYFFPLQTAFI